MIIYLQISSYDRFISAVDSNVVQIMPSVFTCISNIIRVTINYILFVIEHRQMQLCLIRQVIINCYKTEYTDATVWFKPETDCNVVIYKIDFNTDQRSLCTCINKGKLLVG